MKPLVTFGDPEAAARSILLTKLADRDEVYAPPLPAGVSTSYPSTSLAGDATHLQVELENADAGDYPIVERDQVRVTAHAAKGKRTNVKALASLAQGLLCAESGVFPRLGRSGVSEDPTTGNLMCWFIVRVDIKATQLA